jgi:hypothetical protein
MSVAALLNQARDPQETQRALENVGVATVGGPGDLEALVRQLAAIKQNPAALVTGQQAGPNILPTTSDVAEAAGVDEHWLYQVFGMDPGGPLGELLGAVAPVVKLMNRGPKVPGGRKRISGKRGPMEVEVHSTDMGTETRLYDPESEFPEDRQGYIKTRTVKRDDEDLQQVFSAFIEDPRLRGQGYGSEMYRELIRAMGKLESDDIREPHVDLIYQKLGQEPGFKVDKADTHGDRWRVRYLDPSPEGRAARADDLGYTHEVYHGTHEPFDEIDEDAVDLGIHVGSWDQATNRLSDVRQQRSDDGTPHSFARGRHQYLEGAQVKPLRVKMENTLEMEDVGAWDDSTQVMDGLFAQHQWEFGHLQEAYDEAWEIRDTFESQDDWIKSPENREFLDEVRNAITDQGYDSISYENQVENKVAGGAMTLDAQKRLPEVQQKLNALETRIQSRRAPFDMSNVPEDQVDAAIKQWSKENHTRSLATPEELKEWEALRAEKSQIMGDRLDTKSYIILKPENVRHKNAEFDPEKVDINDLNAMNELTTALAGRMA